jgi:RNA polymerase sigma-70 factor (ECF subfamily)
MADFEEIYKLYFDDVFRFLRGLTANEDLAEELTGETFFKALRALNKFNGSCDVRVWLCQIAKNSYYTYLKKQKQIVDQGDLSSIEATEKSIEKLLIDKEAAFQLHQLLHNLADPYKEVFSLRVFGELSFKQIALLFGKSEHWACVTYHRAKGKIQERMEDDYEN